MKNRLIDPSVSWIPFSEDMTLLKNKVYVFSVVLDEYYAKIKEDYTVVLSEHELNKSSRYLNARDRERFISAKYLLRQLLSGLLSLDPGEIKFHTYGNHKPAVEGIEFNIAHSGNYILIAISPSPVGVDIEQINTDFRYESILTPGFSTAEVSFIRTGDQPVSGFYTLWTRKEAILKASGEGLTDELDQVQGLSAQVERAGHHYTINTFSIQEDHVASLAIQTKETAGISYFSYG